MYSCMQTLVHKLPPNICKHITSVVLKTSETFKFFLFFEKRNKIYFSTRKPYKIIGTKNKRAWKLSWVHLVESQNPSSQA